MCLFIVQKKRKKNKININLEKEKKRKEKLLMSETFYNIYHTITTKQIYYSHTLNVIILVSSTMFQIYNIISCDSSYMPLYCPRNKIKRKEKKKNNQIKIKYKSLSIL